MTDQLRQASVRVRRTTAGLFAVLLITACGEGALSPDQAVLSIRLEPASATVVQGASITVTGFATVGGSFSGSVTFAVTGLPAGVTVDVGTVVPPSGGDATYSAPIEVAVGASVAPGVYSGTVTAEGAGGSVETTYSLTVTEAATGSFSLSSVSDASIAQGSSANRLVTITRDGGFTGNVSIAVEGVPAGVSATPSPTVVSGASSSITLLVDAGAATGVSTLTVRGSATGLPDFTTTFQLTITPLLTTTDFVFDYSACELDEQPVWAAVQDGAGLGSWSRVTEGGAAGGIFEFSVTQSTFGVALVTEAPSETEVLVGYYGVAQIEDETVDACPPANAKNVGGDAVGLVGLTSIAFGGVATPLFADGSFIIGGVPEGIQDLVAYSANNMGGPDRMVITRDLNIPNNGLVPTVDFGAGFTPATATITIDGLTGSENGFAGMDYATTSAGSTCAVSTLYSGILPTGGATSFEGRSAPLAQQMGDEFHVVSLTSILGDQSKRVKEAFASLTNRSVALPSDLPAPSLVDVSTGAYLRLSAAYTLPSEYDDLTSFGYVSGNNGMLLFATGDAMSSDVTLAMPDFSGVTGWDDAWAVPAAATGVQYILSATGLTTREPLCTEGGRQVQNVLTGSYN